MPRVHYLSIYAGFSGKKRTSLYILGEKALIFTSKHGTTIFFSYYNLFQGKLKENLARKARVNTVRVHRIVVMPPWASDNTP